MSKRQPSYLRGIKCSVPHEAFKEIANKWKKKLQDNFIHKGDYDSALVNEGILICNTDPSILPEYIASLKTLEALHKHSLAISTKSPFFIKPKVQSTRLAPKISRELNQKLMSVHGNATEVSLAIASYAMIGYDNRNGGARRVNILGEYLNGDAVG